MKREAAPDGKIKKIYLCSSRDQSYTFVTSAERGSKSIFKPFLRHWRRDFLEGEL